MIKVLKSLALPLLFVLAFSGGEAMAWTWTWGFSSSGYRHCRSGSSSASHPRVHWLHITVLKINLRRHYDNLDGKSYKLGRRHDHRPVRRQLYRHG